MIHASYIMYIKNLVSTTTFTTGYVDGRPFWNCANTDIVRK